MRRLCKISSRAPRNLKGSGGWPQAAHPQCSPHSGSAQRAALAAELFIFTYGASRGSSPRSTRPAHLGRLRARSLQCSSSCTYYGQYWYATETGMTGHWRRSHTRQTQSEYLRVCDSILFYWSTASHRPVDSLTATSARPPMTNCFQHTPRFFQEYYRCGSAT